MTGTTKTIHHPVQSALDATLEIVETVTSLLDAYERGDDVTPPWPQCRAYLGEARGALVILQMDGARLLTDECVALIDALEQEAAVSRDHALDALLQALLVLPRYLERARDGHAEIPEALLPTINGLRGLRRALPIPEYDFADLAELDPEMNTLAGDLDAPDTPDLKEVARMRQMLQVGLLGLFRAPATTLPYKQVRRALARLADGCGDCVTGRWLLLGAAVAENAVNQEIPANGPARLLLSRLDFYIRGTLLTRPAATEQPPPPMVRQALLYYAARHGDGHGLLEAVAQQLDLSAHLTSRERIQAERDSIAAPDSEVMEAVSSALGEELEQVKSFMETVSRMDNVAANERDELHDYLAQLGNTLTLVGLSGEAATIKREYTRLQSVPENISGERLREMLSDCVDTLSACEYAVARLGQGPAATNQANESPGLQDATRQALHEALGGLGRVRHSLEYFNGDRDHGDDLASAQAPITEVRGTLDILGHERAAQVLASVAEAIARLDDSARGDSDHLNAIADAITGIEWYMEGLVEGIGEGDAALNVAEEALSQVN